MAMMDAAADVLNETGANNSSSEWNSTVEQFLLERLGARSKDTWSAVVLTVVYSVIFLSGSVGNICTCIVIVRNHCMQTTTNYYLFSLAVSDLMLLFFGLPPELFSIWQAYPWTFGEAFCYIRHTVLELTSYASVLTITAFTVERYIAVCRPLLSHKIAVLSRAVKIIVCIWVVSLVVALPYAVHTRLFYAVTWPPTGQPLPDSLVCSIPKEWLEGRMSYMFQISTFLFFLAPVTLITCLYILIGVAVRRSPLSRGSSDEHSTSQLKHTSLPHQPRRVVIRMLVAVTVAFIICWAPFHTQRLMVLYVHSWTPQMLAAQSHIFYVSGVLYFVSSTVNPILYNVISRRYRVAFRQTICGPCRQYGRRGAFFSRQSVGSHAASRHGAKKGGEQAYIQQRHSLLGPESPPVASLRQPTFSQKSNPSENRASGRGGVRRYSSQATLLAPTWCPAGIRWKRKKAGGDYSAAVETKYSLDEPGQSHSHYFQLKALPESKLQTHREAPSLSTNHCNNVLYSSHHQPGDKVLCLGSDKPNQLCNSATGSKKACTKDEQRVNKTSPNLPQPDTHTFNVKRRNDSNDNSYSPKSNVEDSVDRTYGTICVSGAEKTPPFASSSSSSHQHSVARESGSSVSLCKQCLTTPSPTPNGSAPYSDVDAYHVGYDVSKPHSHL